MCGQWPTICSVCLHYLVCCRSPGGAGEPGGDRHHGGQRHAQLAVAPLERKLTHLPLCGGGTYTCSTYTHTHTCPPTETRVPTCTHTYPLTRGHLHRPIHMTTPLVPHHTYPPLVPTHTCPPPPHQTLISGDKGCFHNLRREAHARCKLPTSVETDEKNPSANPFCVLFETYKARSARLDQELT